MYVRIFLIILALFKIDITQERPIPYIFVLFTFSMNNNKIIMRL